MKFTQNPTLSSYLLEKAGRFLMYPQRISGTPSSVAARRIYDQLRHQMVDWRKTFAPQPDTSDLITGILGSATSLDELYCREFLEAIPATVERTRRLSYLTLTGITDSEFVYLREAANCYILGLPVSATALARAAVETSLRQKLEKVFGKSAIAGMEFKELIDNYSHRGQLLSKEGRALAHKVRSAGNEVLHQQNTVPTNTLEVIESARRVILELAGVKPKSQSVPKGT